MSLLLVFYLMTPLAKVGGNYASGISQESEVKLDASIIPDTASPLLSSAYPNLNLGGGFCNRF